MRFNACRPLHAQDTFTPCLSWSPSPDILVDGQASSALWIRGSPRIQRHSQAHLQPGRTAGLRSVARLSRDEAGPWNDVRSPPVQSWLPSGERLLRASSCQKTTQPWMAPRYFSTGPCSAETVVGAAFGAGLKLFWRPRKVGRKGQDWAVRPFLAPVPPRPSFRLDSISRKLEPSSAYSYQRLARSVVI